MKTAAWLGVILTAVGVIIAYQTWLDSRRSQGLPPPFTDIVDFRYGAPGESWRPANSSELEWLEGEWCQKIGDWPITFSIRRNGSTFEHRFARGASIYDVDPPFDSGWHQITEIYEYQDRFALVLPTYPDPDNDPPFTFFAKRVEPNYWEYFQRKRNRVNELTSTSPSHFYSCTKCRVTETDYRRIVNCSDN